MPGPSLLFLSMTVLFVIDTRLIQALFHRRDKPGRRFLKEGVDHVFFRDLGAVVAADKLFGALGHARLRNPADQIRDLLEDLKEFFLRGRVPANPDLVHGEWCLSLNEAATSMRPRLTDCGRRPLERKSLAGIVPPLIPVALPSDGDGGTI